jgi:tetratricopeptide (TPR) repeat protein
MPEDKMLLNQVSHLYRQLDAIDKYYTVVDQLIKETPNDPNIYYNSAVTSAQNNHPDRAEKYYKKALEIDPDYINAEVNLSLLLLEQDKLINDEMNTLGASETDNERYEKLKQQRIDLYREVLPYLESIVKSQPQNNDFAKKLINIYSFLGNRTHIAVEENIDE